MIDLTNKNIYSIFRNKIDDSKLFHGTKYIKTEDFTAISEESDIVDKHFKIGDFNDYTRNEVVSEVFDYKKKLEAILLKEKNEKIAKELDETNKYIKENFIKYKNEWKLK
jgi:hypothetical protein